MERVKEYIIFKPMSIVVSLYTGSDKIYRWIISMAFERLKFKEDLF